jgi:hypothetical protein
LSGRNGAKPRNAPLKRNDNDRAPPSVMGAGCTRRGNIMAYYEERQCEICGNSFGVTSRHPGQRACGIKCGAKLRAKLKRVPVHDDTTDTWRIPLTQGYVAIIDAVDADLTEVSWFAENTTKNHTVYAARSVYISPRRVITLKLHRVIMERILERQLKPGELVDHMDRVGTNCRRSNLRLASPLQNARNRPKSKNNSSGFKGVTWHKRQKKWNATIRVNYKAVHLGCFDTAEEAYEAYCVAERRYFGAFTRLENSD